MQKDPAGEGGYGSIEGLIQNSDTQNPSGLTKTGPGMLLLTNKNNSYDGPTIVNEGVLALGNGWTNAQSIPGGISNATATTGSNLELNGGNVRLAYYLKRSLGSGPGQLQITGGASGFSHIQPDTWGRLSINNNTNYEVVWGSDFFKPDALVLNEENAEPSQVVQFQNKLDLNGATRTVATNAVASITPGSANGYMTTAGGRITGVIRDSVGGGGLIKTGPGHLQLTAANTYDGGTTINEGELEFTKIAAMPSAGEVTVNDGTTLTVAVGGSGEWTTGSSGNGTLGGLLAGLGGQAGSTVSFVGTTNLGLNVSGDQSYSGVIASAGNIMVKGSGSLQLTGDNTFSGDIYVDGGATLILSGDNSGANGAIRIVNGYLQADPSNIPAGGVIYDSPGNNPAIVQGSGAFAPTTGNGNDLYWSNGGGFAASDAAFTVSANGGDDINWRSGNGFNGKVLHLGSPSSTAPVEITNNITFDRDQTIRLFNNTGSSDDVSILSGNVVASGDRHLYVGGQGTLALTGTNQFGSGNKMLQISDNAVVRAVDGVGLPAAAVLYFNTGRFESSGTFERNISNASGNVYWNGRGGFAANGGPLNVNLQGGATILWDQTNGGFRSQELYMGSDTADNVVTMTNNIDLRGNRTIRTYGNPNSDADAIVFSGVLANGSGSSRSMQIRGSGTLLYTNDNTYTGETRVHDTVTFGGTGSVAGKLRMERSTKLSPGTSIGTLSVAGNLELDQLAGHSDGKLLFELGPISASDKVQVGGEINIGAAKLDLGDFEFTDLGGLENGTYTLISGVLPVNGTLNSNTNGTLGDATIDLQISDSGSDIELVVSGLTASDPYATWATGNEAFDGDANGDGISNGMAFLMGAADPSADARGLMPAMANTAEGLQLSFTMLDSASRGDATLNLMHSADLGTWTEVAIPESDAVTDGVTFTITGTGTLNVTATIAHSHAVDGKLFGRVGASEGGD